MGKYGLNSPFVFSFLTNEPGKESWPIIGATFILMQQKPENPARNSEVLKLSAKKSPVMPNFYVEIREEFWNGSGNNCLPGHSISITISLKQFIGWLC